ncbi:hypothetical protein HYW68_01400, partial [Candidatus Parcubacteria bacterium]|nr:hypothetical protein [Candidatus Parcubacteria bacterium]
MDRQKVEEFFERIVRRRAERLGISLEEAAKVPNAKPLFLEAAEERARLEGKTTEQVLAEYRQRLEDSTYPT